MDNQSIISGLARYTSATATSTSSFQLLHTSSFQVPGSKVPLGGYFELRSTRELFLCKMYFEVSISISISISISSRDREQYIAIVLQLPPPPIPIAIPFSSPHQYYCNILQYIAIVLYYFQLVESGSGIRPFSAAIFATTAHRLVHFRQLRHLWIVQTCIN